MFKSTTDVHETGCQSGVRPVSHTVHNRTATALGSHTQMNISVIRGSATVHARIKAVLAGTCAAAICPRDTREG
jgi:hypothetical protein